MTDMKTLVAAVIQHVESLPKCRRCNKMAVSESLDAAHMGFYTCKDHQFVGGFDNESGPYPLKYAETANKLLELISDVSL